MSIDPDIQPLLDGLAARVDAVDSRLAGLESGAPALAEQVAGLRAQLADAVARIEALETATTPEPEPEPPADLLRSNPDGPVWPLDAADESKLLASFLPEGLDTTYRTSLEHVSGAHGVLTCRYQASSRGSDRIQFPLELGVSVDAATLRYRVELAHNWDGVKEGKLPGLSHGAHASGGAGDDRGWSARMGWTKGWESVGAELAVYAYHPDRSRSWGEWIGTGVRLQAGGTYRIEQTVVLNTPGETDGQLHVAVNGVTAVERPMRWRLVPEHRIDTLFFSTFFGGGDSSYSPRETTWARFSDFEIVEVPR